MKNSIVTSLSITLLLQMFFICFANASACNYTSPGYVVNRFIDNDDGTVFDTVTNLTWQRCNMGEKWNVEASVCVSESDSQYDWKSALNNTLEFNQNEFAAQRAFDWRLPNIKELASIINLNCSYPALDTTIFDTTESNFWSSTPSATLVPNIQNNAGPSYIYENYIWGISVLTGKEFREPLNTKQAVLLVRGVSEN